MIQAAEMSARIITRLLLMPEYKKAQTVFSYASILGEVSTTAFNGRILGDGKRLCLPKITGARTMDAVAVEDIGSLRPGAKRIPEPYTGIVVPPDEIDLVVVPGLAFDLKGGRIGFNGGYYDVYLAKTNAFRAALAFEMQIVEDAFSEEHDQKMDALLTEDHLYRFSR